MSEPLIYDICQAGRRAVSLPDCDVPKAPLPAGCVREDLPLPEVASSTWCATTCASSQRNYGVDTGLLPARLVHHEVQPEGQRGGGAPAGLRRHCIRSSRRMSGARARSS